MQHFKTLFSAAVFAGALSATALTQAAGADDHKHNHENGGHLHDSGMMNDHAGMGDMFMVSKEVDGYKVSFHVMKAQPGKEMGGSYDFMIKVEKDGKVLGDVVMNTKVVYPDGTSETKSVMKMGEWYMAGYDLKETGQHQMMVLFKTADGNKHKAGVFYGKE
jgi:hypothetical protein